MNKDLVCGKIFMVQVCQHIAILTNIWLYKHTADMFSISLYIFEDFDFLYQFSKYLLGYFEYLFSLDENGADIRYFHLGAYSIFFCRPSYFFRLLFALLYFFQQIIHIKKNHMFGQNWKILIMIMIMMMTMLLCSFVVPLTTFVSFLHYSISFNRALYLQIILFFFNRAWYL